MINEWSYINRNVKIGNKQCGDLWGFLIFAFRVKWKFAIQTHREQVNCMNMYSDTLYSYGH